MTSSMESLELYKPLLKDVEVEEIEVYCSDDEMDDPQSETQRQELERALVWKLDKRMSILVLLYILNIIDRTNVGTARLHGFEDDLHLQGQQFATVLAILYTGYIVMQIPSNMLLTHIGRPSIYLPVCMALWGLTSLATGFATNYTGVLITRFLLGILEASFFPGALFLLSKWYKHTEMGFRTTLLLCGSIISNAFGALIAAAILDSMQGVLGFAAWRWLFFVEGAATVGAACCAMCVLPDFPETTRAGWLTAQELRLAQRRMRVDSEGLATRGMSKAAMMKSGFWLAMKDGNVFLLTLIQAGQMLSMSFGVYFPTLTATLGYGRNVSLLLCAPPYMCAAVLAFFISRRSDKHGERFTHVAVPFCIGTLGLIIPLFTTNIKARYVALFFMAQSFAGVGVLFAWCGNTFPDPPAKRAVALAFINSISQLVSIPASYIWPDTWGPSYRPSYVICAFAGLGTVGLCYVFRQRLIALNRKLAQEEVERGALEKGFRYLL